jgi:uncharacterized damage-inducible protein DinB
MGPARHERERTKLILLEVRDELLDWMPADGGSSIGSILYHLAAIELSYLYEEILGSGWSAELATLLPFDISNSEGNLTVVESETLEENLGRLDASRDKLLSALEGITEEDLRRPRKIGSQLIATDRVLHHLMQHKAEHRGQIGEILHMAKLILGN